MLVNELHNYGVLKEVNVHFLTYQVFNINFKIHIFIFLHFKVNPYFN